LWSVPLDRDQMQLSRCRQFLSDDERERANQYHFAIDRHRFIVRRSVLRTILAGYFQADPGKLQFHPGRHGKLHLAGDVASCRLDFSLAHSGGRSMIAVAIGQRIGVDLECVRPLPDLESLIRQCLTRSEKSVVEKLSSGDQLQYFYQCWTGKEACLKASGEGLSRSLDSVEISWHALDMEGIAAVQTGGEASEDWFVQSFSPWDGYRASIACVHRPSYTKHFAI
jgi:4'-phosphopantetheinyl transferase